MKLCSLLAATICCAVCVQATDPERVEVQTIKDGLQKLPPVSRRILVDFDRWTPEKALQTPAGKLIGKTVLRDAEAALQMPPCKRIKEGKRLLGVARQVLARVNTLAMAWKMTGDIKYARRGIDEMLAASRFSDWNPSHFLDTGEMAVALSVGAACFDPVMTQEEKKIVADALWEKAVMMSIPDNPDGQKLTPDARPQLWWLTGYNNWVPVCHSGVVAAALIAGDRDPDTAAMVIQRAIRRLPVSMRASYSPNGSYPEGPGYWGYGSEFNSVLIALLDHAFGTNFGLADIPGWSTTGNYMAAVTAPSGDAYNYSDGGARVVPTLPWFFLESRYPGSLPLTPHDLAVLKKRSEYKAGKTKLTGDRLLPLALIWLGQAPAELPERPLWYYSGDTSSMPLVIFRSAWTPDAVYLGIKGGGPKAPHAHMDAGSFLIEAEGVRWVTELGMEPYNPLELRKLTLWNSAQESDRWRVFRIGPDSHSIVRINAAPQLVNGWGTVKSLHTDPGKPMQTTLDLKSLYHNIDKFERTAELSDQGVRISDTLAGLHRGARVRFQFCTKAAVEIQGNTVILRSQDKAMKVVLSEPSITWQSADAKQWMQEWDSDNGTAQMVWFETAAPESGKVAYTVDYIPGKVAGIPAE